MVTPEQLIERANKWLVEKGRGPLSPGEIILIVKKMAEAIEESNNVTELEKSLALHVATNICRLRGYAIPNDVKKEKGFITI